MNDKSDSKWHKIFNESKEKEGIEASDKPEEQALEEQVPTGPIDPTYTELKQDIDSLKAKAEANWDKYLREVAEKDNVRKRLEQEVQKMQKYGTQKLIEALLPALDGLTQGLENSQNSNEAAFEAMRQGLELTEKMMLEALGKFGVEPLIPLGEAYDPNFHEAIAMQPSQAYGKGQVMAVVQRGYKLHGRIVRPARVIVVKAD